MRLLLLAATVSLLTSCTPKGGGGNAPARVVNLAIWSSYVTEGKLKEFERRAGTRVQVTHYSSNEELLAKLQAGGGGYDVVVPSDYMVKAMIELKLLRELEPARVPNAGSVDPRHLRKPYDPANRYSFPYHWGTTGIAVNRALHSGPVRGWKDVFENPALAGKFSLLDDVREALGVALRLLGHSMNTRDPAQLEEAKKLLIRVRPKVKAFTSEPMAPLADGEVAVAHAYVTDALRARQRTGGKVDYVIPEEGATLWFDNLAIPAGAPHPAEAHALMDFLLEAATEAETTRSFFAAPANLKSLALLPPDLRGNPALFPPPEAFQKLEMLEDLGEATRAWDRAWAEVKAGG
jgi:spermidine/putrescine transport system substrate-binding protein